MSLLNGKQNILLIEDDPEDAALIQRMLADLPYPVQLARDGEEALDYLFGQKSHEELCMVLLDLRLPKVSGLDVLREIRRTDKTARLPVVILTGHAEEENMLSSYRYGANSFLRKPPDPDELIHVMGLMGAFCESAHLQA
ncbi:MAG TPA: response regulator [Coleofasciculaceae cyanobacterium]